MKKYKLILVTIGIAISIYILYLSDIVIQGHKISWEKYRSYLPLLQDSIVDNIDTLLVPASLWTKNDVYTEIYCNNNTIIIWEFKDISFSKLSEIIFEKKEYFNPPKISSGQTFFNDSDFEVSVKHRFSITSPLVFQFYGQDVFSIDSINNCKGFYGRIIDIGIFDNDGNFMINIFNKRGKNTLFLAYLINSKLFILGYVTKDQITKDTPKQIFKLS